MTNYRLESIQDFFPFRSLLNLKSFKLIILVSHKNVKDIFNAKDSNKKLL